METIKFIIACLAGAFLIFLGALFYQDPSTDSSGLNGSKPHLPDFDFAPKVEKVEPEFFQITDDAPRESYSAKHKRPYRKKPRRKKIKFPEDCTDEIPAGQKVDYLKMACSEALAAAIPDLQKAAEEGNCDRPIDDKDNHPYPIIDDYEIRQYTIKESDEKDIDSITKKLDTVFETIKENNELEYPIDFKAGQTLNYQKAHYAYSFEPTFYPFSSNKYLVEIRCFTAAYNADNIYLLYDESAIPAKAKVLDFLWVQPKDHIWDDFTDQNPPSDDYIAKYIELYKIKTMCGFHYNQKTKTLFSYSKGNGMGKFGRYARYSFTKKGKPKLEEFRARFYDDMHNQNYPNYSYEDMIKRPPKTWKRYYP